MTATDIVEARALAKDVVGIDANGDRCYAGPLRVEDFVQDARLLATRILPLLDELERLRLLKDDNCGQAGHATS